MELLCKYSDKPESPIHRLSVLLSTVLEETTTDRKAFLVNHLLNKISYFHDTGRIASVNLVLEKHGVFLRNKIFYSDNNPLDEATFREDMQAAIFFLDSFLTIKAVAREEHPISFDRPNSHYPNVICNRL